MLHDFIINLAIINIVYNKYVKRGQKSDDWEYVCTIHNETSSKITKANYFSNLGKSLSEPMNETKSYWTTLKKAINEKTFSNIPPLVEN